LFSEIMVSTDSEAIAQVALQYGATVPFYRSEKTANDYANLGDVVEEVLTTYNQKGLVFDNVCCILATAPFVTGNLILEAYQHMIENQFDSVFPVVKFSYPIQRALRLINNRVEMIDPENFPKRSQDLEPTYHDAGQFYWMRVEEFFKQKRFFSAKAGVIVLPDTEVQDIDTEEDWKLAEIKYLWLKKEL